MRISKPYLRAIILTAIFLTGCGPKNGDRQPGLRDISSGSKVVLKIHHPNANLELPENLRTRFIDMLHRDSVYVDFSGATAAPLAEFEVDGLLFYWHGNSVVYGDRRKGRVWTSPVMQALIDKARPFPATTDEWKRLFAALDAEASAIDSTVVQGLGRYPKD